MIVVLGAIFIMLLCRSILSRKHLAISIGVVMFLLSIGKDIEAYVDLLIYKDSYYFMKDMSVRTLFTEYMAGERKDFAYATLSKLFSGFGVEVEVWFGFIALFFAVCVAFAIYRHSADPFVSAIILMSFYFVFTFSGLRQTIAMGLVLLSYRYIKERKLFPYLVLLGLAFLFHSSAIIFIPAYWLARFRIGIKQWIATGCAFVICIFAPGIIRSLMGQIAWTAYLQQYADRTVALSWSGYLIQLMMLLFCYILRKSISEEKRAGIDPYINLMVIGLCLAGASTVIAELFRMSYYYAMASMFALPNVIVNMEKKNIKIAYVIVFAALIAYMFFGHIYTDITLYGI